MPGAVVWFLIWKRTVSRRCNGRVGWEGRRRQFYCKNEPGRPRSSQWANRERKELSFKSLEIDSLALRPDSFRWLSEKGRGWPVIYRVCKRSPSWSLKFRTGRLIGDLGLVVLECPPEQVPKWAFLACRDSLRVAPGGEGGQKGCQGAGCWLSPVGRSLL